MVYQNNYYGMSADAFRLGYHECLDVLCKRLGEPAPGRIQLLSGPRQVGKTTLLLEIADRLRKHAVYAACDAPEASLPGFWERLWEQAEDVVLSNGRAVVLLDEAHLAHDWAAKLKGVWDRLHRTRIPIHVVATGSSALRLAAGSRESLAGRFERMTLAHWSARSLARAFGLQERACADLVVRMGSYPGAFGLRNDAARWSAYVRDSILEPAIGRDILALAQVRRPALLRQVFAVAASSPAQIVSVQKIRGHLHDAGNLETITHYLALLEEAFLVAALPKHSAHAMRRRAAPPKLVTLNNALIAVVDPRADSARFGALVENACLAHAWNSGQSVSYWRQEPFEVDGVIDGSWGPWAIEVKTGGFGASDLAGLFEFVRQNPRFRPLVICDTANRATADRAGATSITWKDFLVTGPQAGS
jgi:uncharacterized protein